MALPFFHCVPRIGCIRHDLGDFIRKLIAESDHSLAQTVFRLDKGLTSGTVLDTIEECGVGYVPKVLKRHG